MAQDLFHVLSISAARVLELSFPLSLDSGEFDRINESLLGLVKAEPHAWWVLDLARLTYMGSATLRLAGKPAAAGEAGRRQDGALRDVAALAGDFSNVLHGTAVHDQAHACRRTSRGWREVSGAIRINYWV